MAEREQENPFIGLPQRGVAKTPSKNTAEEVERMLVERGFQLPWEKMRQSQYVQDFSGVPTPQFSGLPTSPDRPPEFWERAKATDALARAAGILDIVDPWYYRKRGETQR